MLLCEEKSRLNFLFVADLQQIEHNQRIIALKIKKSSCITRRGSGVRVPNSPPYSSYPNPILYEKGSGTFFVYRRFAFATATNTPVGCLSNRTVCVSRWRGFAPTSSAARVRRAANEQRQGIIMAMVSCLLFCGIKFALCELGRHTRDVLSLAGVVYST